MTTREMVMESMIGNVKYKQRLLNRIETGKKYDISTMRNVLSDYEMNKTSKDCIRIPTKDKNRESVSVDIASRLRDYYGDDFANFVTIYKTSDEIMIKRQ